MCVHSTTRNRSGTHLNQTIGERQPLSPLPARLLNLVETCVPLPSGGRILRRRGHRTGRRPLVQSDQRCLRCVRDPFPTLTVLLHLSANRPKKERICDCLRASADGPATLTGESFPACHPKVFNVCCASCDTTPRDSCLEQGQLGDSSPSICRVSCNETRGILRRGGTRGGEITPHAVHNGKRDCTAVFLHILYAG